MTARSLLPFRSARANWFATCAVLAMAGTAATLQPSRADTTIDGTILSPPALAVAAADDTASSRGFRGRDRGPAAGAEQKSPEQKGLTRPAIDKKLTNDQVKDIVEGRIAMSGNANLKVGKIAAKEDGVVSVDITTKTGALVETQDISTKTGLPANMERRFGEMRERFRGGHGLRGRGMMARHHGPDGRGPGGADQGRGRDLALTTDQARKLAEARLIMRGNPHLKVGAVKEKDADTISIDIVASDNSLVSQQLIDRHSGRPQRMNRT